MRILYSVFILLAFMNIHFSVYADSYLLDNVENNHNFNPPANTVSRLITYKKNINQVRRYVVNSSSLVKKISNDLKLVTVVDLSKIKEFRLCTYTDRGNVKITAEFQKKNNFWVLNSVFKGKKLVKNSKLFKGVYRLHEANTCFHNFVKKWEKYYKKSNLRFSFENARISDVNLLINNRPLKATFGLTYVYPTRDSYVNGWLVNSLFFSEANFNNISSTPLPNREQVFHAEAVLSRAEMLNANIKRPNQDLYPKNSSVNYLPILKKLVCHNKVPEKRIRLSFQIDQAVTIASLIQSSTKDNKYYSFEIDSVKSSIKFNNCNFLTLSEGDGFFNINITKFNRRIRGIKYGVGRNNFSFIDFFY